MQAADGSDVSRTDRTSRTPGRGYGTKAKYVGVVLALIGGAFCPFGLYMWGLSGACDTSCGHGYAWLLYFTLPGGVLATAGLSLRWLATRPRQLRRDRKP